MDIIKPIETKYKVEVADKSKRKRVIKENIAKKALRKHPVPIKGKPLIAKLCYCLLTYQFII